MALGLILVMFGEFRRIRAQVEFYGDVEIQTRQRVEGTLQESGGNGDGANQKGSVDLLSTTLNQMNNYDAIARGQAASSYLASLVAMAVGLLLLATGILIAYFAKDAPTKYATAFLTAVGSVTGGYVSKTFLSVQERATKQLGYYFQQPLIQSYVLMAERLSQGLDEEGRGRAMKSIIDGMVGLLHVSPLGAELDSDRRNASSPRSEEAGKK